MAKNTALATALATAGVKDSPEYKEKATKDAHARQGMNVETAVAQQDKELSSHVKRTAEADEMASTSIDPLIATSSSQLTITLFFDEEGNIMPDCFQETLLAMSPSFADVQQEQVDRTFFSTFTDMFRIATLTSSEYGVLPAYTEIGAAWQAAQAPEDFCFDKSVMSPSEANQSEGVLQAMSYREIKAKQDTGLKPLSGAQWTFFIETCERALHGISYLHTMRELGYHSQHTKEDIWQAATENETKRQNNYKLQQEAEHSRKTARSTEALAKATVTGGALDL
jgi:hypothetical protein